MLDDERELPNLPSRFLGTMAIYPNGEVSIRLPNGSMGRTRDINSALGLKRAIEDIARALAFGQLTFEQRELLENYHRTPSLLAEDVANLSDDPTPRIG